MDKFNIDSVSSFIKPRQWPSVQGHEYLLGFRGFLVIQCFLWTFLITFAPNTVKDANIQVDGPTWQIILRKTLSVLFWNGTLIYSFFIVLSARSLALPFFADPTRVVISGALVRRGIRLIIPVAVSLAITTTAFAALGTDYIDAFKTATNNVAFATPYFLRNAFVYFNSVYQLFWVTQLFFTQSGNFAFPSQTLWIINLIYQQSFTVFILMVIVPYTRPAWRVKMAFPFVATAWWVQSWAWYTVTGLLFADMVVNMDFKGAAKRGIPIPRIKNFRIPAWAPALVLITVGLLMQYLFTAWKPEKVLDELYYHTDLYEDTELNEDVDPRQPQARADNWFFIVGFLILLEMFEGLQMIFRNPVLVYLGKRSLSYFLTQSWIMYTAGIKLFTHLTQDQGAATDSANVAAFWVCLLTTAATAEVFYRLVDHPADAFARRFFDWLRAEDKPAPAAGAASSGREKGKEK